MVYPPKLMLNSWGQLIPIAKKIAYALPICLIILTVSTRQVTFNTHTPPRAMNKSHAIKWACVQMEWAEQPAVGEEFFLCIVMGATFRSVQTHCLTIATTINLIRLQHLRLPSTSTACIWSGIYPLETWQRLRALHLISLFTIQISKLNKMLYCMPAMGSGLNHKI